MKRLTAYYCVLLLLLWLIPGWSPRIDGGSAAGTLRGIVGLPDSSDWSNIIVTVVGQNKSVLTDAAGHFSLDNVTAGPVHLQAGKISYENAVKDTFLNNGQTLVINLALSTIIADTFSGISNGKITSASTNVGNLGVPNRFIDTGDFGFSWSGQQQLKEASLMIGVDTTRVSDAARFIFGIAQDNLDQDFQARSDVVAVTEGPDSTIHQTTFDDSRSNMPPGNPSQPLNIFVTQTTSVFRSATDDGYLLVDLKIKNTGHLPLKNLLVGWFVDWNIGGSVSTNRGGIIFGSQQITGFNSDAPFPIEIACQRQTSASGPYMGIVPLSQAQFKASRIASIQNEIVPSAPNGGLREANKYLYMRDRRPVDTYSDRGVEEDQCTIVSVGGLDGDDYKTSTISLPSGGEVQVGFAFVGGNDSLELIDNARKAQKKWVETGGIFRLLPDSWRAAGGWNMVSLPLKMADYRTTALFPPASSSAFEFIPDSGYVVRDTLQPGVGYWLKFPSPQTITFSGNLRHADTIAVGTGWNLIGTLSNPVLASTVTSLPADIVQSSFFGYDLGYVPADTLYPLHGYWVKVSQQGSIILTSSTNNIP